MFRTRSRREYYAQRASAGLQITEASQVSPQGVGYIRTPGMHSPAQVAGWRKVTDAVHKAGGRIFAQLWHVGRVSHPDFHNGALPVAPSALPVEGEAFTQNGKVKIVTPRALELQRVARHRRAIPRRGRECQGRRLRRRRAARRQRLPARPVPARRRQPAHRRLRRQHPEPRAVSARSHAGRDRCLGRRTRRLQALAAFRRLLDVGLQSGGDVLVHRGRAEPAATSATSISAKRLPVRWRRRPARCGSRRSCATSSAAP